MLTFLVLGSLGLLGFLPLLCVRLSYRGWERGFEDHKRVVASVWGPNMEEVGRIVHRAVEAERAGSREKLGP